MKLDLHIIKYRNCIIVMGDTINYAQELLKLGGKYTPYPTIGPGWIFTKARGPLVQTFIDTGKITVIPRKKTKKALRCLCQDVQQHFAPEQKYSGQYVIDYILRFVES